MTITEKIISPDYQLGRIDALNEVLFRIKTRKIECESNDYILGSFETTGVIDDYFNELLGEQR